MKSQSMRFSIAAHTAVRELGPIRTLELMGDALLEAGLDPALQQWREAYIGSVAELAAAIKRFEGGTK